MKDEELKGFKFFILYIKLVIIFTPIFFLFAEVIYPWFSAFFQKHYMTIGTWTFGICALLVDYGIIKEKDKLVENGDIVKCCV